MIKNHMKKLLAGLFIFGFLAIGVQVTHASVLSDALLKISSLQSELSQLKTKLGAAAVLSEPGDEPTGCSIGSTSCTITTDLTPRISYWSGKVNQHVDVDAGQWITDPDGSSGAGIDKLTYCKKWYPNTTSVAEYKNETINAWHAGGNIGDYASTKMSYECIQEVITAPVVITPSITVLSPKGGETWYFGNNYEVKWEAKNFTEPVMIALISPTNTDGNIWCTLGTKIPVSVGKFVFNLKKDFKCEGSTSFIKAGVYQINIYNGVYPFDLLKTGPITIRETNATPSITVVFPNGGQTLKMGDVVTLKWKAEGDDVTHFTFELVNAETSKKWTIFSSWSGNISSGFAWNVGQIYDENNKLSTVPAGKYYINIVDTKSNTNISDMSDNSFTIIPKPSSPITDLTPRISMWSGKVNQHVVFADVYAWQTDDDGVSGAEIDKLTYCKKFYPKTTSVVEYKNEIINDWHARGNIGNYVGTKMSYECVQGTTPVPVVTPSITVLSPNGGESYNPGDKVTVKWKSENVPANNNNVAILLNHSIGLAVSAVNDGEEIVTLPSVNTITASGLSLGKNFKISVGTVDNNNNILGLDESDNLFTIDTLSSPGDDPIGCSIGNVYSSTTGQLCTTTPDNGNSPSVQTLKVGVKGEEVKTLQAFLGITADGSFGPMTKATVMKWQALNGLTADGAFGKISRQKAGL